MDLGDDDGDEFGIEVDDDGPAAGGGRGGPSGRGQQRKVRHTPQGGPRTSVYSPSADASISTRCQVLAWGRRQAVQAEHTREHHGLWRRRRRRQWSRWFRWWSRRWSWWSWRRQSRPRWCSARQEQASQVDNRYPISSLARLSDRIGIDIPCTHMHHLPPFEEPHDVPLWRADSDQPSNTS